MMSKKTKQKSALAALSICLLLILSSFFSGHEKKTDKKGKSIKLKVAAYNVEFSDKGTAQEIGEKLKPYGFDVVCFSEAPGGDWTKEVGEVMGLNNIVVGRYSTAGHKDKYKTIASRTPLTNYEEVLMADTLHTVAVVRIAGTTVAAYIDGAGKATDTDNSLDLRNARSLDLGRIDEGTNFLEGQFIGFVLWRSALPDAEVLAVHTLLTVGGGGYPHNRNVTAGQELRTGSQVQVDPTI